MESVAQGAVWSGLSDPVLDASGNPITTGAGSITATLFDAANADQSTGIAVAHVTGGRYRLTKTIPGNAALGAWGGVLTYNDGVNPVRTQTIDVTVVTAAQADPAAALSAAVVTTISPVDAVTGNVSIVRGDDYRAADVRALTWATTSVTTWPDLTGAAVVLTARHKVLLDTQTFTGTGSVVVAGGATKQVRVEIAGTATAGKLAGDYVYDVQATLASGDVVTLAMGTLTLAADRTA